MKKAISLLLLLHTLLVNAQEQDPWTVYMTPAPIHELLSTYAGSFQMEIVMEGLNEPVVLNSSHRMLLGDRFLELKQNGEMMGMAYASIFTLGYNTIDQTFSMTTITNMGTGTLMLQGKWNEKTQSTTLYGKLTNPVSKQLINVKQIVRFLDDDTFVIESFDKEGDGPERKTVQYKFVRI